MSENYKIGDATPSGQEIAHIYGCQGKNIVFKTPEGLIRWSFTCDKDIYSKATNKYNHLDGKIPSTLPESIKKSIISQLAISLYNSLAADSTDNIDTSFENVEHRINSTLSPNQAKLWLILYCLFSSVVLFIILYLASRLLPQSGIYIMLCAGAGILGSALSLMQRNTKITINLEDGKQYIFLQAAFIPVLGMLSGLCLYLLSNSDLAFSFAKENIFNLLILSIIAGFSERFIPDLFKNTTQNL